MSLKKKWILLLFMTGITLMLIFLLGFRTTLLPSLQDQKNIFIEKLKKRIQAALDIEADNIAVLSHDWSDWDRMVAYLKERGREFEKDALPDAMFTDGLVNMVAILDTDKKTLFYRNYWPGEGFIDPDAGDVHWGLIAVAQKMRENPDSARGFINTHNGPILCVAHPIRDKGDLNRKVGLLIMGRYVDDRMLQRFSSYTTEKIRTVRFNRHQLQAFSLKRMNGNPVAFFEDQQEITIFHMLSDVFNKPAMLLFTKTDSRLFRVVSSHTRGFYILTSVLVIFVGLIFYFIIDRSYFKRMLKISNRMSQIEGFDELSIRVESNGKTDEIAQLAASINRTLDRLEEEKVSRENAEKSMIKQGKLASIGRLTSSIAHEINNPLMAIGNSIQVIKKLSPQGMEDDPELFSEAVEISESEVERIRDIISALLDFHRLDKEEFTRLNLKDILEQALSVLNWGNKLEDIEIVKDLENGCYVMGAPVKLSQVFINFILNAVEAMDGNGGKLHVEIYRDPTDEFALVHFIDNGPGLAAEIKGHLFEPFVSTKEDKGVGLGLYISYKIIENHRGEITYDEDYGDGAHFIIKLPLDHHAAHGHAARGSS